MQPTPTLSERDLPTISSPPAKLGLLRILLVRHGLSEDNLCSIWAGHKDSPLAPAGVVQAQALGLALSSFDLSAIYSSDLKRAGRTAEEILKANRTSPPPPLVQTQSLREQNFGQAEGRTWNEVESSLIKQSDTARTHRFPDGESLEDVNNRMGISLRRYVLPRLDALRSGREGDESQIVIVAHGIAIAELLRVLMALHDKSEDAPWQDPNETYTRVRLENTGWTLVELAVPQGDVEESKRKAIYTRIVQQNNTDHLRSLPSSATNASIVSAAKTGSVGKTEGSAAALLLAGGLSVGDDNGGSSGSDTPHLGAKALNAYDSKYVLQELERAGNSSSMLSGSSSMFQSNEGGLQPSSAASNATSPSQSIHTAQSPAASTLSPRPSLGITPSSWSDLWQSMCVRVLPLFNGEDLKGNVEEVNEGISTHIHRTLDRSPARALDALSKDLYALCATGIYTLNTPLHAQFNDDFRLVEALSETWTAFFTKILPWLEACFLPLQTDSTLVSLSKGHDKPASSLQTEPVDIRKIALTAFRDHLVIPWFDRLLPLFLRIGEFDIDVVRQVRRLDTGKDQEDEERLLCPRLMQMTKILSSVHTNDEAQTTTEELLRALKTGHDTFLTMLNPNRNGGSAGIGHHHHRDMNPMSAALTPLIKDKRLNPRHGWLPASAAKHGNKVATPIETGKENAYLYSLRSPIERQPATMFSADSTIRNTNGDINGSDDIDRRTQSDELPASDATTPVYTPLQGSGIGLGFPSLDQWDHSEDGQQEDESSRGSQRQTEQ